MDYTASADFPVGTKREYSFENNEMDISNLTFEQSDDCVVVDIKGNNKQSTIKSGNIKWIHQIKESTPFLHKASDRKVAVSGTWQDDNTYVMTQRYTECPWHVILTFTFLEGELELLQEIKLSDEVMQKNETTGKVM